MPLDSLPAVPFQVGDWIIDPATGEISREGNSIRLEERNFRLLMCLAANAGKVISIDELLENAWPGVVVSPDSVYQAITALRRQLGDDSKNPAYIATVPRKGYRLVATVGDIKPVAAPRKSRNIWAAWLVVILLGIAAAFWISETVKPRHVAVLPFQDLTDDMNEEPFADGIAEELIGELSKIPGLAVTPPSASYYDQGKRVAATGAARAAGVDYLLDGSVRGSGGTLRVAARLTRASDGVLVWSASYDRTGANKLQIQQNIAGEVRKAVAAALH